jgi:hypothetical protein
LWPFFFPTFVHFVLIFFPPFKRTPMPPLLSLHCHGTLLGNSNAFNCPISLRQNILVPLRFFSPYEYPDHKKMSMNSFDLYLFTKQLRAFFAGSRIYFERGSRVLERAAKSRTIFERLRVISPKSRTVFERLLSRNSLAGFLLLQTWISIHAL